MKFLQVFTSTISAGLFGYHFNSVSLFFAINMLLVYLGLLVDSINLTLEVKNDRIKP